MRHPQRIAIIGGGPAGALAAELLAHGGRSVVLLDEKLAWEKPCGGGITYKALLQYPFLRDAPMERNLVAHCELISPRGRRAQFHLDREVAIFSRQVLNQLLLERAARAGAELVRDRVTAIEGGAGGWTLRARSWPLACDYVVIAAGARTAFRQQFTQPFRASDLMATAGYYLPITSDCMRVRFLAGVDGYIWVFPRRGHASAGICGKMDQNATADLRRYLEQFLRDEGLSFEGSCFYSHVLPAPGASTLRQAPFSGPGWAMIGDAAGFVDAITGEGIYYALRSAEHLAEALLDGQPESYPVRVERDFLPELELAGRLARRFYHDSFLGQPVIERMVEFTQRSARFRQMMCDIFSGAQIYSGLRSRFYRELLTVAAQCVISPRPAEAAATR